MGVTNYLTVNGEILSETRNGVSSDYIPDPLGSTAKVVNSSGTVTDEFEYWPYGELLSHTGSNPTPFQFVGTQGYYCNIWGSIYIRARTLLASVGQFSTITQIAAYLDGEKWYEYSFCNPTTFIDPTGQTPNFSLCWVFTNPISPIFTLGPVFIPGRGTTPVAFRPGRCKRPADQTACNNGCQTDCKELGHYGGSSGTLKSTPAGCTCTCSCKHRSCSLAQTAFCQAIAAKYHRTFVSCTAVNTSVTNLANCNLK